MFSDLLNSILPSIEHFRIGGYWLAFFSALLETTVGIGLILPGSTIILVLGALSARGYLDVGDLIWFSIAGAVVGDNVNFYLGRKYGARWLKDGFWIIKADYIAQAKSFMDAHGARSIFLGRFIPSVKEFIPLIAGSVNMNRRTFLFWNVLGAVGWGFEWVLAGYIFGQSLNLATLWLSRAGLMFAFLVILSGLFYGIKRLVLKKGQRFARTVISLWHSIMEAISRNEHVLRWKESYPRVFSFLRTRFDTTAFSGLPLSILALSFIYVLILFAGIVEDLITSDPIIAADLRIAHLFYSLRSDGLTELFTWITLLGKSEVVVVLVFISAAILWIWRKTYQIFPLMIAVAGSTAFTHLGKMAFRRPRPEVAMYVENSFSFPSGHATIAVALYGFFAYLLIRSARSWNASVHICFVTMLLIIAIGLSRIYLGVHYLSDVWSGYLVGAMWLIAAVSCSEWCRWKENHGRTRSPVSGVRVISFALVISAVIFYIGFSVNYHPSMVPVTEKPPAVVSSGTDVFSTDQLKFTETLIGDRQEPINVVLLAGSDAQLIAAVQRSGWILNDPANVASFVRAIQAWILKSPYPSAPISPSFWNARIQDLSFANVPGPNWLKDARHIKIWRTECVNEDGRIIYVGMTNANDGFTWGIMPKINPDLDSERETFFQDLNRQKQIREYQKIQLVEPLIGENFVGDQFFTDGKAYIVTVQ